MKGDRKDKEQFQRFIENTRATFYQRTKYGTQPVDVRVALEDMIICFDQCVERLTQSQTFADELKKQSERKDEEIRKLRDAKHEK